MAITHGMNVEAVERVGRALREQHSPTVRQILDEIDRAVNDSAGCWSGPDAEQFRSWWPEKRSRLQTMAEDLAEFGRVATANAEGQREVSDDGVSPTGGGTFAPRGGSPGLQTFSAPSDGVRNFTQALRQVGTGVDVADLYLQAEGLDQLPAGEAVDDVFSYYGYGTELYSAGDHAYHGEYVDAGLDTLFLGGDVASDRLKEAALTSGSLPTYLGGVTVQTWTEVGRAAREVDWSPEGLQLIADASLSDWAEVLPGAFIETGKLLPKILL